MWSDETSDAAEALFRVFSHVAASMAPAWWRENPVSGTDSRAAALKQFELLEALDPAPPP